MTSLASTHVVAKDALELLVLLLPAPESQDDRREPPQLVLFILFLLYLPI